jgi:hypothetical protein
VATATWWNVRQPRCELVRSSAAKPNIPASLMSQRKAATGLKRLASSSSSCHRNLLCDADACQRVDAWASRSKLSQAGPCSAGEERAVNQLTLALPFLSALRACRLTRERVGGRCHHGADMPSYLHGLPSQASKHDQQIIARETCGNKAPHTRSWGSLPCSEAILERRHQARSDD